MTYRVIKVVKGRGYIYEQRTWREGKRVRTESRYIGPVDGGQRRRRGFLKKVADLIQANLTPPAPGFRLDEERLWQEQKERESREEQAREAKLADLHSKYGLRLSESNPVTTQPKEQATILPAADNTAQAADRSAPADEGASGKDGQDDSSQ
jgi:hypothetical protein